MRKTGTEAGERQVQGERKRTEGMNTPPLDKRPALSLINNKLC